MNEWPDDTWNSNLIRQCYIEVLKFTYWVNVLPWLELLIDPVANAMGFYASIEEESKFDIHFSHVLGQLS